MSSMNAAVHISIGPSLASIWNLLLFVCLCYKFHATSTINKPLKYLSLSAIFIAFSCYGLSAIATILNIRYGFIDLIVWILFAMMIVSFYLYHALSLYVVFKDTLFAITKQIFYCHCVIVMILLILPPALSPLFINIIIYYITISFLLLLTFIGLIHIMYKFNHNLFLLVLMQKKKSTELSVYSSSSISKRDGDTKSGKSIEKVDATQKNMRDISILITITKQSLLSTIQIVTLILLPIVMMVIFMFGNNIYTNIAWSWIQSIAIIIYSLCIYLGFSINYNSYQCLCSYCHKRCIKKCDLIANSKMDKNSKMDEK